MASMLGIVLLLSLIQPATPLRSAHAHNDYLHQRPLLDALDHGFCSVEADVFRVGDDLLVAHERRTLKPDRTLRALYLDPLRERVRSNRGRVYPQGPPFTLLVDIKEDGPRVYDLLRRTLLDYRDMLTEVRNGKVLARAVTVVLSGDCPREAVLADRIRHCAVDGRLGTMDTLWRTQSRWLSSLARVPPLAMSSRVPFAPGVSKPRGGNAQAVGYRPPGFRYEARWPKRRPRCAPITRSRSL